MSKFDGGYEHTSPEEDRMIEDALRSRVVQPCNRKSGVRDKDGHAWVTTMLGWPWPWRCYYCRRRRRGAVRPDKR